MNDDHEESETLPTARSAVHGLSPLRVGLLGDRTLCSAFLRILLRESDEGISTVDVASVFDRKAQGVSVAVLPLLSPHASTLAEVSETVDALDRVPLVVLIDRANPQIIDQLISRGVRGVLTLDVDVPVVAAALRLVNAGGVYVPAQQPGIGFPAPGAAALPGAAAKGRLERLSPRERAVLDLLRRSLSNREIAETLRIAEATVKIHVRNLLRKTKARNRVELALLAARGSY
jgi:DNA-binding NarL/FixJ family response regulator